MMFQALALCQENDFEAVSSSYYPIPTGNLTENNYITTGRITIKIMGVGDLHVTV